jgi:hypothetical protein
LQSRLFLFLSVLRTRWREGLTLGSLPLSDHRWALQTESPGPGGWHQKAMPSPKSATNLCGMPSSALNPIICLPFLRFLP